MNLIELQTEIDKLTSLLNEQKSALITYLLLNNKTKMTLKDNIIVKLKSSTKKAAGLGINYQLIKEQIDAEQQKICYINNKDIREALVNISQEENKIDKFLDTKVIQELTNQLNNTYLENLKKYDLKICQLKL
jgi:hypothetical protein